MKVEATLLVRRSWPDAGGCLFPIDPALAADGAPVLWLPQLDPTTVILVPAPAGFRARSIRAMAPEFRRLAGDVEYWLFGGISCRIAVVLTRDAIATSSVAALIPFDAAFRKRTEAVLRFWRFLDGDTQLPDLDRLTAHAREYLILKLRALDARLEGHSYRTIAQGLFGEVKVPKGVSWTTHEVLYNTRYLVREGERLMKGGYRDLLGMPRRAKSRSRKPES